MKIPRIAYAAYGFALIVILLDQLTKAWIMSGLDLREMGHIQVLPPLFNLTWVENRGVSFGLFGDGSARWMLSAFSIAVAGFTAAAVSMAVGTFAFPRHDCPFARGAGAANRFRFTFQRPE